jgi:hypothetical protein
MIKGTLARATRQCPSVSHTNRITYVEELDHEIALVVEEAEHLQCVLQADREARRLFGRTDPERFSIDDVRRRLMRAAQNRNVIIELGSLESVTSS